MARRAMARELTDMLAYSGSLALCCRAPHRQSGDAKMILCNSRAFRHAIGSAPLIVGALCGCSNSTAIPRAFVSASLTAFYDPNHNNQSTRSQSSSQEALGLG